MKMDRRNPGGEGDLKKSMKGCELGQKKGQGSMLGAYPQIGSDRQGLSGPARPGTGHALKSFSGATVTGSSKAAR